MWFPSRTGGTLSPKPDLWEVPKRFPKRFQNKSKMVPRKCPKRYVCCRFCDFVAFPIYSKKAPKRFRKGSQNDYERVPKTTKMWCPKKSKIWFPSRTGGILSQKSDLRKVSIMIPKTSQKGSRNSDRNVTHTVVSAILEIPKICPVPQAL